MKLETLSTKDSHRSPIIPFIIAAILLVAVSGCVPSELILQMESSHPAGYVADGVPDEATVVIPAEPSSTPTALAESPQPSPTAMPTGTATATPTPQPSPTAEPSPTPTATPEPIPLPTPDGVARTLRMPVLMYHYISEPPPGAGSVRRDLSVPPERFASHLRALRDQGYTTISLHDLTLALQIGHPLPEKPIVITFDDGYRDNYENAFPILQEYGYTGTFFLITSVIDEGHPDYMSWDQVIEMAAAGMEMQAHGKTHDDLRGRSVEHLVWQMLGPKESIEAHTGTPVRFFCYPSGRYDAEAIQVLHSAHYWGAATTRAGVDQRSDRMFELPRIRVRGDYDATRLLAVISSFMQE